MVELSHLLMAVLEKEEPSSTNYIIAEYIMKNARQLKHVSTSELAEACHVSKASISRFCRNIGLDDFFMLRALIQTHYPAKIIPVKYNFVKHNHDDIMDYLDESVIRIQQMRETINRDDLDELTDDLHQYKSIYLLAVQQSSGVALSLQNDLGNLGKFVKLVSEPKKQKEVLEKCTSEDLVIIFTATGQFIDRLSPRMRNIKKDDLAKIYCLTVSNKEEFPFVYRYIQIGTRYNLSGSLLLNIYSSLIAINYKNRHYVSFDETETLFMK